MHRIGVVPAPDFMAPIAVRNFRLYPSCLDACDSRLSSPGSNPVPVVDYVLAFFSRFVSPTLSPS